MTRYADPERCPDCRRPIAFRAERCESCELPLHGPLAQRLFQTLTAADVLLVELRASAWGAQPAAEADPRSSRPAPAPSRVRSRLSAASVPQLLLGLGAVCVLVAALVFLAVSWSVLGVSGRTAVLLALTALAGAAGGWLAGRRLRAAAEALVVVALGLLALDLVGADQAGWLGDLGVEWFLVVLGGVLATAAAAAAVVVRWRQSISLVGAQVIAGIGAILTGFGLADVDHGGTHGDLVLAVMLVALAAVTLRRSRLDVAATVAAVGAGGLWLILLGVGAARVADHASYRELWLGAEVWPALAAAALAGSLGLAYRLPIRFRVAGTSLGMAVTAGAGLAPLLLGESATAAALAVVAGLVPAALVAWFAPRPWGLAAATTQLVGLAWLGAVAAWLAVEGGRRLVTVADGGHVPSALSGPLAPWLLPLCALAIVGTLVAACQASAMLHRAARVLADPRLGTGLVAMACTLTAPLLGAPAWVVVAVPLVAGTAFVGWWWRVEETVTLGVATAFLVVGVGVAQHADSMTLAAALVVLVVAVGVRARGRQPLVADLAGMALGGALAALIRSAGDLLDVPTPVTALSGVVALALLALLAGSWADKGRAGLEIGAAAFAVPLGLDGVLAAPTGQVASWTAIYLTVAGVAVTGLAMLRPDRRGAAWPGAALLAAATWVRLYDLGVQEPEAYTLPSALALLAAGLWRLHRDGNASTNTALGPGLGLALLPSLVWALDEPTGLRTLLLGLGCLGLVLAGLRVGWTAPVAWGAVVGAALVLRLAAPYVGDAVPRWVLIGAAGALLITMGVTWERRLAEARRLHTYVRALR